MPYILVDILKGIDGRRAFRTNVFPEVQGVKSPAKRTQSTVSNLSKNSSTCATSRAPSEIHLGASNYGALVKNPSRA